MDTTKPRAWRPSKEEVRVSEMARREADRRARRVRWERLLEARKQYVEWSAFSLWVRVILESEGEIPPWLSKILEGRCPGFLDDEWRCRAAQVLPALQDLPRFGNEPYGAARLNRGMER